MFLTRPSRRPVKKETCKSFLWCFLNPQFNFRTKKYQMRWENDQNMMSSIELGKNNFLVELELIQTFLNFIACFYKHNIIPFKENIYNLLLIVIN